MVSFRIDHSGKKLILSYPTHLGLADEIIQLTSNRNAMGVWRLRVRSYVMNTMMSYYKNRQKSLSSTMTSEDHAALKNIRRVLLDNYEGKLLEKFLWKVMLLAKDVVQVAPRKNSKHYNYYNNVIYPMYRWIDSYLRTQTYCKCSK